MQTPANIAFILTYLWTQNQSPEKNIKDALVG